MRDYGKVCLTERIGVCVEDDVDFYQNVGMRLDLVERTGVYGNKDVNERVGVYGI